MSEDRQTAAGSGLILPPDSLIWDLGRKELNSWQIQSDEFVKLDDHRAADGVAKLQ